MSITSESAKAIARLGANMEITAASGYTSETVKEIVRIAVAESRHATVHAAGYTSETLKDVARIGKANVTIVI